MNLGDEITIPGVPEWAKWVAIDSPKVKQRTFCTALKPEWDGFF